MVRIYVVGVCMGAADLVPGVSGGTVAFAGGIYPRLLDAIKSFDLVTLRMVLRRDWGGLRTRIPWLFLIPLGLGLVTAIFSLSHLLSGLFLSHPVQLWAFFFGLVAGSILLLVAQTWRWKLTDLGLFLAFAVGTYWVVGLPVLQFPDSLPFVFLSGAIAICAMILPGISGSYILVILGRYHAILDAVNARDFVTLGVFVCGIVVGILSFVRLVSWLLHTWRHATLIALTGVMAGALRTVWPWKETIATRINSEGLEVPMTQINAAPGDLNSILIAVVLAIVGGIAVWAVSRLAPERS
jgi:putative membrane protein